MNKIKIIFVLVALIIFSNYFACTDVGVQEIKEKEKMYEELSKVKIDNINKVKYLETPVGILEEKPEIRVKIGIHKSVAGGILLLADALGYFEDLGVYPTFIQYPNYNSVVEAFHYDNVDMAPIGLYESMLLLLQDVEFMGILPLTYSGLSFVTNENSGIESLNDLDNAKIGLMEEGVDLFLLYQGLDLETNLTINDLDLYYMPREIINDAFSKKYMDGAFLNCFDLPSLTEINVIYEPTKYSYYKVNTLLVRKEYANNEREALELVISAYKKGLLYFKQHKNQALEIISDENRLNVSKIQYEKALGYELIIDIMDEVNEKSYTGKSNEEVIRNSFFHSNGVYNKEAREILDFVVNNVEKYNRNIFKNKLEDIKLRLLRSKFYTIVYLAETDFDYMRVKKKDITDEMREKWELNLKKLNVLDISNINYINYGIDVEKLEKEKRENELNENDNISNKSNENNENENDKDENDKEKLENNESKEENNESKDENDNAEEIE